MQCGNFRTPTPSIFPKSALISGFFRNPVVYNDGGTKEREIAKEQALAFLAIKHNRHLLFSRLVSTKQRMYPTANQSGEGTSQPHHVPSLEHFPRCFSAFSFQMSGLFRSSFRRVAPQNTVEYPQRTHPTGTSRPRCFVVLPVKSGQDLAQRRKAAKVRAEDGVSQQSLLECGVEGFAA